MRHKKGHYRLTRQRGLNNWEETKMDQKYEAPELEIISFETDDIITASGDYAGIDFEKLI